VAGCTLGTRDLVHGACCPVGDR